MTEEPKGWEDLDEKTREFLSKKTGVMIAVPNLGSQIVTPLMMSLLELPYRTFADNCPFFFKIHLPPDLTPVEYARNECVREFLKDPFYKRLYFIDADMNPPPNWLDLLDHDEPIVSGMTYIWMGGRPDERGFYLPPMMKINAFDYRPGFEDFISRIPSPDNQQFYCDAAGASCMVIRRDVLEAMPEPWFRTIRDPYGKGLRGEDLDFCKRAKELLDVRVLYIPKVTFGHIKRTDLNEVTKYGISAMRNIIRQMKAAPDKIDSLPDIRFSGEAPPPDEGVLPKSLKVVQGGKA